MGFYDDQHVTKYSYKNITLSSADATRYIKGPKGCQGLLWDYGCEAVTTTFAGASSTPKMEIGVSGTLAKHGAAYDFSTMAAADATKSIRSLYKTVDAGFATYMVDRNLAADVQIYVTMLAATGGGAAGVGDFFVEIKWYDQG